MLILRIIAVIFLFSFASAADLCHAAMAQTVSEAKKPASQQPGTFALYGTDIASDQLLVFNLSTGAAIAVGSIQGPPGRGPDEPGELDSDVESLAYVPKEKVFYGFEHFTNTLVSFSRTPDGLVPLTGPLGPGTASNLARDPTSGRFFWMDYNTLNILDVTRGISIPVGTDPQIRLFESLAFTSDGRLYGIDYVGQPTGNVLVEIDKTTGQHMSLTALSLAYPIFTSLAIHPSTSEFYGATLSALWKINPSNGAVTLVGNTGFTNVRGLDFVPVTGKQKNHE